MKNKNLTLIVAAIVLSAFGAVAYYFTPEDVYVRAVMVQALDPVCINTHVQCDLTGDQPCRVYVPLRSGLYALASSAAGSTVKPYRGTACVLVLNNYSALPLEANLTGDDRPISIE